MSERLFGWLYCRTRWPLAAVLWRWRVSEADRSRLKQRVRTLELRLGEQTMSEREAPPVPAMQGTHKRS